MNHERENLEEKYPTHPFVLAVIDILGPIWDKQLLELRKQGMLPDKKIVYEHKPHKEDSQEKIE